MGIIACGMHELGHIIALLSLGIRPKMLSFDMIGIKLVNPGCILSPKKELFVLLSGSGLNLLVFFLLSDKPLSSQSLFALIHLLLGVYNLLPLKSFDGGKILNLILSGFLSQRAVYIICNTVDFIFIILMLLFCGFLIFYTQFSFTLLVMSLYLLFSSVMKLSSGNFRRKTPCK